MPPRALRRSAVRRPARSDDPYGEEAVGTRRRKKRTAAWTGLLPLGPPRWGKNARDAVKTNQRPLAGQKVKGRGVVREVFASTSFTRNCWQITKKPRCLRGRRNQESRSDLLVDRVREGGRKWAVHSSSSVPNTLAQETPQEEERRLIRSEDGGGEEEKAQQSIFSLLSGP